MPLLVLSVSQCSRLLVAPLGVAAVSLGCVSSRPPTDELRERALALSISELQMHLSGDVYQSFAHVDDRGRNAFSVALWRLDQLEREALEDASARTLEIQGAGATRAEPEALSPSLNLGVAAAPETLAPRPGQAPAAGGAFFPSQGAIDADAAPLSDEAIVIEFARGRALGRLRRYRDAANAFARVELSRGLLWQSAAEHRRMMDVFASLTDAATRAGGLRDVSLDALRAWSHTWTQLATALADSEYAPLARIESEVFEQAEVEHLVAQGEFEAAIDACQRLLANHRESKLYARHLIRLGDLYADQARREHMRARAARQRLDVDRYERSLERAFAAYELASEARKPLLRREARSKIDSLLAYHEGVRSDVH